MPRRKGKGRRNNNDDWSPPPKGRAAKRAEKQKKEEEMAELAPKKQGKKKGGEFQNIMSEATGKSKGGSEFTIKTGNFSLGFKGQSLLEDTELTLAFGRRYGLVGINGSGKSTLLRHIATRQIKGIPEGLKILHVEQEATASEQCTIDSVIEADTERLELMKEQEELEREQKELEDTEEGFPLKKHERLIEVYKELSALGAHNVEARARAILSGLQFTKKMQEGPTCELSGGWRMRLSLARALFCRPHVLLLDEPTNHLDLYACIWFEEFLSRWTKTLFIVSHDIELLNHVCTDIVHLEHTAKRLDQYKGNYDHFVERRKEKLTKWISDFEKQKKEIARLRKQSQAQKSTKTAGKAGQRKEKRGGGGRETKNAAQNQAKAARQKLEALKLIPQPPKQYKVSFKFPTPERLSHPVLQIKNISFHYPLKEGEENEEPAWIFKDINMGIDLDSRVALVGPNGAGKSTLLNLITGDLEPTVGEVVINRKLRAAKFDQHSTEQLPMDRTPVQYCQDISPELTEQECRKILGRYGLTGKVQVNLIETLSGGQKSRVKFAGLALQSPHILFLDEPTNHLDIESIEALCESLAVFEGGVVLVTHDQNLIAKGCNFIWCVDGDGTIHQFDGDFYKYQKQLINSLNFDDLEDLL